MHAVTYVFRSTVASFDPGVEDGAAEMPAARSSLRLRARWERRMTGRDSRHDDLQASNLMFTGLFVLVVCLLVVLGSMACRHYFNM